MDLLKVSHARKTSRRCDVCGEQSALIMKALGVCRCCLLERLDDCRPLIQAGHAATRTAFGLPEQPPDSAAGAHCVLCARGCRMAPGERGFCGLREGVLAGSGQPRIRHIAGRPSRGLLQWYRDPLPTNCVADWVCAGHKQPGRHNLAVFYTSCTFNCLFCQNWHFRRVDVDRSKGMSAAELAALADEGTFCVCYFGGDPASQMPHALASATLLALHGVRVCWETAGTQHPRLMERAADLASSTGGTVKFDLKAFDPGIHLALTGADNRRTLANFERIAGRGPKADGTPLVVASTLLVPGYVTAQEVARIARFIAAVDPSIPYSLLGFAPRFAASDLPPTSVDEATAALAAAREAGLTRVHIANRHLLLHSEP